VIRETTFSRNQMSQGNYLKKLSKKLTHAFNNKDASDFLIIFSEEDEPDVNHAILVQPSHPRLYDSNVGEVIYDKVSQIVQDLRAYCKTNKVNSIQIQSVGAG
jgi:hypothetical protein